VRSANAVIAGVARIDDSHWWERGLSYKFIYMLQPSEVDAIISDVLRGDNGAFRPLMRDNSLWLRSYIAAHVHHLDVVDDLAQEVFIAAFRHLGDFRRGEDFRAWLRGMARKKIYEYFRNSSRHLKAMGRFHEEVARVMESRLEHAVSADDSRSVEVLMHCIKSLPDRMRRVVHAGLDGDKPRDLAQEMKTTVGAVYRLHYRANQLLRQCVQKVLVE
jgi:RNA polymerase sigma-70 factor, ECF subfamily